MNNILVLLYSPFLTHLVLRYLLCLRFLDSVQELESQIGGFERDHEEAKRRGYQWKVAILVVCGLTTV